VAGIGSKEQRAGGEESGRRNWGMGKWEIDREEMGNWE